jgi:hypothetical protein
VDETISKSGQRWEQSLVRRGRRRNQTKGFSSVRSCKQIGMPDPVYTRQARSVSCRASELAASVGLIQKPAVRVIGKVCPSDKAPEGQLPGKRRVMRIGSSCWGADLDALHRVGKDSERMHGNDRYKARLRIWGGLFEGLYSLPGIPSIVRYVRAVDLAPFFRSIVRICHSHHSVTLVLKSWRAEKGPALKAA